MCIFNRGVMVTSFPAGSNIQKNPDTQTGEIGTVKYLGFGDRAQLGADLKSTMAIHGGE